MYICIYIKINKKKKKKKKKKLQNAGSHHSKVIKNKKSEPLQQLSAATYPSVNLLHLLLNSESPITRPQSLVQFSESNVGTRVH